MKTSSKEISTSVFQINSGVLIQPLFKLMQAGSIEQWLWIPIHVMWVILSNRNDQVLVTNALQQALDHRECQGLIHHSDQGSTYTSNSNIK